LGASYYIIFKTIILYTAPKSMANVYNGIQIQHNKSTFYVATKKYQTLLQVYYIIHLVGAAAGHFSFWRVKPQLRAVTYC